MFLAWAVFQPPPLKLYMYQFMCSCLECDDYVVPVVGHALHGLCREEVQTAVVDVNHAVLWVLKVTHYVSERVVRVDEAVGVVFALFHVHVAFVVEQPSLDSFHIDGDGLLCHTDGGGLVCDGLDAVVDLVVDNRAIAEHRPVIHLDEERVKLLYLRVIRGDWGNLVPPPKQSLLVIELDVNRVGFVVVQGDVMHPLVDVVLNHSFAVFGGHDILDAAAGGF